MPGGKVSGAQRKDLSPFTEFGIDPPNGLFSDVNGLHAQQNHPPIQDSYSATFDHQLQQDRLY